MKRTLSLILSLIMILSCAVYTSASDGVSGLRFGRGGDLTILHLTDTQDDQNTARQLIPFLEKAIETAKPDLIVLTGDIVEDRRVVGDFFTDKAPFYDGVVVKRNGKLDYEATLENVKTVCAAVLGTFEKYEIPFVIAQGNNDYKANITNEDWLKIYASYPHCLNAFDLSGDSDGHIDSYVDIASSDGERVAYRLWMLDNGRRFTEEQAEWMKGCADARTPSLAFAHRPVIETAKLFEQCSPEKDGAFFDINTKKIVRLIPGVATGHAETVPDEGDSTMFDALKASGVLGAFFGHTHVDGYTGTYDSVMLGLTYGCEFSKLSPYGMRTITLHENTPDKIDTDVYVYSNGKFSPQDGNDYDSKDGAGAFMAKILGFFRFLLRPVLYRIGLIVNVR